MANQEEHEEVIEAISFENSQGYEEEQESKYNVIKKEKVDDILDEKYRDLVGSEVSKKDNGKMMKKMKKVGKVVKSLGNPITINYKHLTNTS